MDDFVGRTIEHYRVVSRLGRGGMGVVYRALDERLERFVAIKILPPVAASDRHFSARLLREARAASALSHPGVVTIHEVLVHDGHPCIVMELVDGDSLDTIVDRDGALPVGEALRICAEAASVLAAAHARGILHRDVKSGNLMRTRDGRIKVLDFGLAKRLAASTTDSAPETLAAATAPTVDEREVRAIEAPEIVERAETVAAPPVGSSPAPRVTPIVRSSNPITPLHDGADAKLTVEGTRMGTPGYVSPELARGEPADARTDVYSLGCVLYELCVGAPPFRQSTWPALVDAVERGDFVRPSAARPSVPAVIDRVVARALGPRREDRFASMEEMRAALEAARASVDTPGRARGPGRRLAMGAAGVAAAAALAWTAAGRKPAAPVLAPGNPASAPTPASFVVEGDPAPLARVGECAHMPAFADDGTLVFAAHDHEAHTIRRFDADERTTRALAADPGENVDPSPGPDGRVAYVYSGATIDSSQVRSVSLDGGPVRVEVERGSAAWVAAGQLFYLNEDNRMVRRRTLDGGVEETLYEAPSARTFLGLVASPDGRFVATGETGIEARPAYPLCVGDARAASAALDCASAGATISTRAAFSPTGRGLYFGRRGEIARLDLATRETTSRPLPFSPTSLAVARDGARIVASSCELVWEIARLDLTGSASPIAGASTCAGLPAVGPHGELAFPVATGDHTVLASTDGAGGPVRTLTTGSHVVTEAAFAPEGDRIAFHDASDDGGGLFVVDASGAHAPIRLTSDPSDSAPTWLDAEHVLFLRAEKGRPFGRGYVVAAAGGEPEALPPLTGAPFGTIPSRRSILLFEQRASGDRFLERTRDGHVHELRVAGAPKGMTIDRFIASSPSGRWFALFSQGSVWRVDVASRAATRVPIPPMRGYPQMVAADDDGHLTIAFRRTEGQLYELRGNFP